MSGRYVPPSRRNKTEPPPVTMQLTTEYFPELVTTRKPLVAPTPMSKPYSALASEWNEKDEEARTEKEYQDSLNRRNEEKDRIARSGVVAMQREYHGTEDYVYSVEEQPLITKPKTDADGWQVIEKKAKREYSVDEKMERQRKFKESEESMYDKDSVWDSNARGTDEWGYRDRRSGS